MHNRCESDKEAAEREAIEKRIEELEAEELELKEQLAATRKALYNSREELSIVGECS